MCRILLEALYRLHAVLTTAGQLVFPGVFNRVQQDAMDSVLKDEFLTCIVCHEVFRDPVTLHCGHSFCAQCVTAYTKTQQRAIDGNGVACPHCKALTLVPDPEQPVDKWVTQIKTGFFVKGLVERFVTNNPERVCSPCQAEGETKSADVLCSSCEKYLCTDCNKFHQRLLSSHVVSENLHKEVEPKLQCKEHPDSVLDMMCQKCDVVVCPRCSIQKHKACINSVVPLDQVMPLINSKLERRESELEEYIDELNEQVLHLKMQVDDPESSWLQTESDIDALCKDMSSALSKAVKENLQCMQKKPEPLLDLLKRAEEHIVMVKQNQRVVREVLKSQSDMARLEVYKTVTVGGDGVGMSVPRAIRFDMKCKTDPKTLLRLVDIKPVFDESYLIANKSKPVLMENLSAHFEDDKQDPILHDIMVLKVNGTTTIIVTDVNNSRVKVIHKGVCKDRIQHLQLRKPPYCLARLEDTDVKFATTVPELNQILFFLVSPQLCIDKIVTTKHPYTGLCFLEPSTFVALYEREVHVIDATGTVLRSLCPDSFGRPGRVRLDTVDTLFITDVDRGQILVVSDMGEIKYTYNGRISKLRGITRSNSGEWFVVDLGEERVIQFSKSGNFIKDVLTSYDGLRRPSGLFVDIDNVMYVASYLGNVKVYKFLYQPTSAPKEAGSTQNFYW